MTPRAVVVVTGSELVRGDRHDLNGPFLARELSARGLEPARVLLVGDREEVLEAALREALAADLCVISGGLGPTHDDRTVELLARVAGRELVLDRELEAQIEDVARHLAERLGRPYSEFAAGVAKQASLPAGALSLGLAGTAPGIVLETDDTVAVALPGPPPELQRLWRRASASAPVRSIFSRTQPPDRRVLRFYGLSESAVAETLRAAGGEQAGAEATVCAHEFEVRVDLFGPAESLAAALRADLSEYLFAEDERPIAELVLEACRERGLSLATAESCTGGLVASRLTAVPGASDVFRGAVVAYANEIKERELGLAPTLLARAGAVSAAAAAAMAAGARTRLGADVAVGVTGVAGPGGGTSAKPVGLVHLCAASADDALAVEFNLPGDREAIRQRATAASLHLLRRLLAQSKDGSV